MTAHPPIDYLIPKQKLYLSCKSFSTVRRLPVARVPFQPLCSEWSHIPAGWPLKQVERRTNIKADQSSRISSIQFPAKVSFGSSPFLGRHGSGAECGAARDSRILAVARRHQRDLPAARIHAPGWQAVADFPEERAQHGRHSAAEDHDVGFQ